jgi:endonuclease III
MPIDTHVFRVARFVGLTERRTADWRTAVEVTEGLRRFDAADPVRFDFALAHLGISGACRGFRDAEVCPGCPLDAVCRA